MISAGNRQIPADLKTRFHVHDLRMEAIFREISALFADANIPLILLKGPHLAHVFYEQPHERPYGDLDILVRPRDFREAARILAENRFEYLEEEEGHMATTAQTNHWAFRSRFGQLIELHRGFAGLERHPAKLDEWFSRAVDFQFGQTPAKGLAVEDLLCHLCIHIGKSFFYFIEQKHVRDLDVLVRSGGIEWDMFMSRCQETQSRAIAYFSLGAAMAQYGTPVPGDILPRLRPGKLRRSWLEKHLDVGKFPIYRYYSKGIGHARKRLTLPLLDGVLSWFAFLARAMAVKGMDIVLRVPLAEKIYRKKNEVLGDR